MDEEMRDSWVKKSEKSERKDGLGFGGRWMIAMMIGFGPGSLKTRCSKDGAAGMGRG